VRRDVALVLAIALAALGIRTYPAWNAVFHGAGVSFLETDAWYHVRLVENQVRNYPWRVTADPFASAAAQFVPIAPLFDTITSTVVRVVYGREAKTRDIESVAALMPPIFGVLTVIATWALARDLFDRRAGLIAAGLLTVLPGHFMDRTMLGFVDHHALEALLAICVLWGFARAASDPSWRIAASAGVALGGYLLAWGSGAFLVAILGAWLLVYALIARDMTTLERATLSTALASVVALVLVLAFQEPAMHRYATQILGLAGLLTLAILIIAALKTPLSLSPRVAVMAALGVGGLVAVIAVVVFARDVLNQTLVDVARLTPDPARMGVLEARPLFLYSGNWDWTQPWRFFRTGVVVGAIAVVPFAVEVWRRRSGGALLIVLFALATGVATVGQNRFGYYLVTACALLGGWLATQLLDWAGVPHAGNRQPTPRTRMPLAREVAIVAIAGGMFAPNLAPSVLLAQRTASFPIYWRDTMAWVRQHTPPPFAAGAEYYYANYDAAGLAAPDYTVLSWWDHGYWITQQAHRVPVANPTQERAPTAGAFYTATEESEALTIARTERSHYVLSDFELPFRRAADGSIMGRFQTIVDWTGKDHDQFYEVAYRRDGAQWIPVWLFREPYYRSMAFRLSALGGAAATPADTTTVVMLLEREDEDGFKFREVVAQQTFATYADAQHARDKAGPTATIVGLDPWRSAFPLEALQSFIPVHDTRTPEQGPAETAWVRVFQVR
jgi:oligosaccharyl transferase (archaeosortase A-associated)